MRSRLPALASVILVAGCSAGGCDPSQAGFLSGIGCEASGSYNQRNQAQQLQFASSRSEVLTEQANAIEAKGIAGTTQAALVAKRQRLRTLDQQNVILERRLAAARANARVNQAQLASAQAQFAAIQRQRAGLSVTSTDATLRENEKMTKDLLSIVLEIPETQ